MTSKTLIVALAMLLTATSASMAWSHRHMTRHHGMYNYSGTYHHKGGPGPRVQTGSGQGAGAESGSKY